MASSSRRPAPTPAPTGNSRHSPEAFQSLFERNEAAEILQRYEMLSWYSFIRCESLTQTRLHFQNIVAGFSAEDEASLVHWKEDYTPHPPKPGETSRKGKERVSSGANAVAGPSVARVDAPAVVPGTESPGGKGKANTGHEGVVLGSSLGKKKRRSDVN
ncbi:hypothetical protein LTR56_003855 [Elasticomyces elasticus]|nr:hypothetical protein LTR22_022342 [Elasticomyces elasticus]KAK3654582.1 hypothetical protein LTR56_003855 [Elasticomyces elasticus]KAK4908267.1 hypothetical protein LTR49_022822 [Elasticomyces elasticus]KAK5755210.1 hypothetical protein LTS12_014660 [Elasticomyces elasticus]